MSEHSIETSFSSFHNVERRTPPKTIVMTGMMGCGKSSAGRRIAQRLGIPFYDSDQEIENSTGFSVLDIYEMWGEEAFRDIERSVVEDLVTNKPVHVLSTGDGTFVDPQLNEIIKKYAMSIWLRSSLDTIYKRVQTRNTRPLLLQGDPYETLKRLIEEREAIYATADFSVDSNDHSHEETVNRILKFLNGYLI